jgi:gliding motility-associated lipoprotein GldH
MISARHICILLLFGSLTLLWACQNSVVYQEQQSVPAKGWHFEDHLLFEASITDTLSLHKLYLDIRNNTDYAYSNLFLFLDIEFPDGRTLRDTIECTLADRRGQWTGSGFGRIRFNRFLFRDDVWFPTTGNYRFIIYQGMREDTLEGITDAGIRIEKK